MFDKNIINNKIVECLNKGNLRFKSKAKISKVMYMGNATKDCGKAVLTPEGELYIKLSVHFLDREFDWMVSEIIPHEVAHIIAFWLAMNDGDGSYDHDDRWKEIAEYLGATGESHPEAPDTYDKDTYKYKTSTGNHVILNKEQHDMLQNQFKVLRAKDGGRITAAGLVNKKGR